MTESRLPSVNIEIREARGLRGRKGADVWQRYLDAPREKQIEFLSANGVPEERMLGVRAELVEILAAEGIVKS